MSAFHFANLTPDLILDALANTGVYLDSGLTALNSYENRVYQFRGEDQLRYVVKFYRPERWSAEQIREEHALAAYLQEQEVNVACPLLLQGQTLHHYQGFLFAVWPSLGGGILSRIIWISWRRWGINLAVGIASVLDWRSPAGKN